MPDAEQGTSARMRSNGWSMSSCHFDGWPGVADPHFRFEFQPPQVVADTSRARCVAFERDELKLGQFEQMAGLAAGRGARVEHAHAVARAQQLRGELRAASCTETTPSLKAGNAVHRHRRIEFDGVARRHGSRRCDGSCSTCRYASTVEWRALTRNVSGPCVLPERRALLATHPAMRVFAGPRRSTMPGSSSARLRRRCAARAALRVRAGNCRSTALTSPLANDELAARSDRADRLIDHGERRVGRARFVVDQQRQRAGEHMTDVRRRRLSSPASGNQPFSGRETAHRAIRNVLHRAARGSDALPSGAPTRRRIAARPATPRPDARRRLPGRAVERKTQRFGREMQHRQTGFARTRRRKKQNAKKALVS
jgi:hypothetical protein